MNPWIVLDRDGIINVDREDYVRSVAEWQPMPGCIEAIAALSQAGYSVVVATNQSGLSRGLLAQPALEAIHEKMLRMVTEAGGNIRDVFYCPHLPEDGCDCRKPRTGMLEAIEKKYDVSLRGATMVGDSLKDIQAARTMGCQPVLVRTGKGTQTETTTLLWPKYGVDILIYDDLAAFAKSLLEEQ